MSLSNPLVDVTPKALVVRLKPSRGSSVPADCQLPVLFRTDSSGTYRFWHKAKWPISLNEGKEQWCSMIGRVEVSEKSRVVGTLGEMSIKMNGSTGERFGAYKHASTAILDAFSCLNIESLKVVSSYPRCAMRCGTCAWPSPTRNSIDRAFSLNACLPIQASACPSRAARNPSSVIRSLREYLTGCHSHTQLAISISPRTGGLILTGVMTMPMLVSSCAAPHSVLHHLYVSLTPRQGLPITTWLMCQPD